MSEPTQGTDPTPQPGATDTPPAPGNDTPPAPANPSATNPQGQGSATGEPGDETITLKKSDYNNLISKRDSNHQQLDDANSFIESIAQERGINNFLQENKEKYPDIAFDDLAHVTDPADLEKEADRLQTRLQKHAQDKLLEIENAGPPRETPDQRAAREAELAKNPGRGSLEQVIAGRLASL